MRRMWASSSSGFSFARVFMIDPFWWSWGLLDAEHAHQDFVDGGIGGCGGATACDLVLAVLVQQLQLAAHLGGGHVRFLSVFLRFHFNRERILTALFGVGKHFRQL